MKENEDSAILKESEKAAILIALGFVKKEVANMLNKSVKTIDNQIQKYYRINNCKNSTDLTRFVVKRYTGIPVEEILTNILKDIIIVALGAFAVWMIIEPEIIDTLKTSLVHFFNKQ